MKLKRNEKHFFFYRDWFVFPFAIEWTDNLGIYIPKVSRLSIHFLWWHWRWLFIEEEM